MSLLFKVKMDGLYNSLLHSVLHRMVVRNKFVCKKDQQDSRILLGSFTDVEASIEGKWNAGQQSNGIRQYNQCTKTSKQ